MLNLLGNKFEPKRKWSDFVETTQTAESLRRISQVVIVGGIVRACNQKTIMKDKNTPTKIGFSMSIEDKQMQTMIWTQSSS